MSNWSTGAKSENLVEFARRKVREARYFFGLLVVENGQESRNEPEVFGYLFSAVLSAGRSVTSTLEERHAGEFKKWRDNLLRPDRKFLTRMDTVRDEEVHRGGAKTEQRWNSVPLSRVRQHEHRRHPLYLSTCVGPPGCPEPVFKIPAYYIAVSRQEVEVTACCQRYAELLARLIDDYEKSPW